MSTTIAVAGHQYFAKRDHRDRTPDKSQWTIREDYERSVFERTVVESWLADGHGWGLHLAAGSVNKLGESARGHGDVRDLFVAFFVMDSVCHGYPSDPIRSPREIPPTPVRRDWLTQGMMRPSAIRKMSRGVRWKP